MPIIEAMKEDMAQRIGLDNNFYCDDIPTLRKRFEEKGRSFEWETIEAGDIVLWEYNFGYTIIMYERPIVSEQYVVYFRVRKTSKKQEWGSFAKGTGSIATTPQEMREGWVSGSPYRLKQPSPKTITLNYSKSGFIKE